MSNVKDNEYFPITALFEIRKKPLYASGVQAYILRPRSTKNRWLRGQKSPFCTRI